MIHRSDLRQLQAVNEYPSVSILAPTHRTAPDKLQDPIRVKNLVAEAKNRLLTEFSAREMEPLFAKLDGLVEGLDFERLLDGLALYVNKDLAQAFTLPFTVTERVVVDPTFATRDLVFTLNRTPRYYVLALSEKDTRLFEGFGATVEEIRGGGFPMRHEGAGGATRLPGGQGVNTSAQRDEAHRDFFRAVDEKFGAFQAEDKLPLVVAGVDRYFAFFREVSRHTADIAGTLEGNYDASTEHEIAQLVWPIMQTWMTQRRSEALERLDAAVGAQKSSSTIGEVWRMAKEGRGDTLLVEQDFHYPARVDETGLILSPAEDATAPDVIDDAVDEVIEEVMTKGGSVVFVDDVALAQHQRIALILRY
jgi:Bacterial archaeo-eukaryotic release factor family 3